MQVYLESMSCGNIHRASIGKDKGQARGRAPVVPCLITRGVSRVSPRSGSSREPFVALLVLGGRLDVVDDEDIDGAGLLDEFEAGLDLEGFDKGCAGLCRLGSGIGRAAGLRSTHEIEIDIEFSGEAGSIQHGDPVQATHSKSGGFETDRKSVV